MSVTCSNERWFEQVPSMAYWTLVDVAGACVDPSACFPALVSIPEDRPRSFRGSLLLLATALKTTPGHRPDDLFGVIETALSGTPCTTYSTTAKVPRSGYREPSREVAEGNLVSALRIGGQGSSNHGITP